MLKHNSISYSNRRERHKVGPMMIVSNEEIVTQKI